jgi:hypothetical protein
MSIKDVDADKYLRVVLYFFNFEFHRFLIVNVTKYYVNKKAIVNKVIHFDFILPKYFVLLIL